MVMVSEQLVKGVLHLAIGPSSVHALRSSRTCSDIAVVVRLRSFLISFHLGLYFSLPILATLY